MKNLKILNLITNEFQCSQNFTNDDDISLYISTYVNNGAWGVKYARWLPLSQATSFELSREDDRRETINDNITFVEIHVPDDFTVTIEDITAQYEAELEDRKTKRKEELAANVITSVITIIKNWPIADKLALLARGEIQAVMKFLEYGSLDQSKTLLESLVVDTIFTQEIKDKVLAKIQEKIDEYNSIVW